MDIEARVPADHPLRLIREILNQALTALDDQFERLYSDEGRPGVPPERLLRASLLQLFYSIRSERQLMERIEFDLLFRWFVGLGIDDAVWDPTVFTKNRDRLLDTEVAQGFLSALLAVPRVKQLLSRDHFTVDGTLLKAWASMKSFRPKGAASRRRAGATANGTSTASGDRTKRIAARPTPMPGSIAKAMAGRACSATWAMR